MMDRISPRFKLRWRRIRLPRPLDHRFRHSSNSFSNNSNRCNSNNSNRFLLLLLHHNLDNSPPLRLLRHKSTRCLNCHRI